MSLIDAKALSWIHHEQERQAEQIREFSIKPIPVKLKNCSSLPHANQIEIDTKVNLTSVKEIMVGEPTTYPHKPNTLYVTLLLMMPDNLQKPLLTSYLLPGKLDSKLDGSAFDTVLKEWEIISTNGTSVRYTVKKNKWPVARLKKFGVER
ncbi:hypothetical protein HDV01_007600 [Terramyces sp. JEL0728]|nr:hypothetical protein HDV01_007600 [Terramyces sp. JEL0728]